MDHAADAQPQHPTHAASSAAWPVPQLFADWLAAVGASDRAAGEAKAEAARARIEQMRDPFTAIANQPAARTGERVLFEDNACIVLVDRFYPTLKALVIPKARRLFPTDLSDAELAHLSWIAGGVMKAFLDEGVAKQEPSAWINPPAALTVGQLHVHVQPNASERGDAKRDAEDRVAQWLESHRALLAAVGSP